ncbi:hypothetical protein D3C86_1061020 [compost metagenome]
MQRLPPIIILVKFVPWRAASGEAPMSISISVAYKNPKMLITVLMATAITTACIPALDAATGSFSPILLATTAVAAILKPMAKE